jgi:16S rRNA (guanine(527)-N(7))-methyltransferase RsmG
VFAEILRQRLGSVAELSPAQIDELEFHFLLLNKWNKILNLTSLNRLDEIVERHYCESIFLGSHLPKGALHIADIGSGAGFPGFPVAVLRHECSVTLIESHQRKSVFLREAARRTSNVRVLSKRIEEVDESFDWAVSRAVGFSEIEEPGARISPSFAMLGGNSAPSTSRFTWNTPIQLPWGRQRYLWIGSRHST